MPALDLCFSCFLLWFKSSIAVRANDPVFTKPYRYIQLRSSPLNCWNHCIILCIGLDKSFQLIASCETNFRRRQGVWKVHGPVYPGRNSGCFCFELCGLGATP